MVKKAVQHSWVGAIFARDMPFRWKPVACGISRRLDEPCPLVPLIENSVSAWPLVL